MRQLTGHTSPETAYVVDDYPYGFRLRCKIRYWIETKPGFGQRFVSQTTNPKKPGEVWNKPKAGTYSMVRVMYIDENTGHVETAALSPYADAAAIKRFSDDFHGLDEYQRRICDKWLKAHAAVDSVRAQATARAMQDVADEINRGGTRTA